MENNFYPEFYRKLLDRLARKEEAFKKRTAKRRAKNKRAKKSRQINRRK